jgi:gliding motility-associated-like protein
MKGIVFLAGGFLASSISFAQITKLEYGINFPANVGFIDADAAGNAYVAGTFDNNTTFNGTTLASNGNSNVFILKIDPGGAIIWAKGIGGLDYDEVEDIDVDDAGNVLVAGSFNGEVDFDPDVGEELVQASPGASDGYVLKLTTDGDFDWVRVITGADSESITSVATDASSTVYVAGWFTGDADLDPTGTDEIATASATDAFFINLNADGSFGWARTVGNSNFAAATGASVDFSGTPVFSGDFQSELDIDPGAGVELLPSNGVNNNIFLLKLDPSTGGFVWGKALGTDDSIQGYTLHAAPQNNIYVSGLFNGTGDFDPGSGERILTSFNENTDIFISKFHPSGALLWAHSIGGSGDDFGSGIYSDGNSVYTTGMFNFSVDFDPGSGESVEAAVDDGEIFILKLDGTGAFKSVIRLGDASYDEGRDITGDAAGNIYVTGMFSGPTMDMDPSGCTLDLDPETDQSWVLKFGTAPPPCVTIVTPPKSSTICAGSASTVTFSVAAVGTNLTYQWYTEDVEGDLLEITDGTDYSGTLTSTLTVDVTGKPPGYSKAFAVEVFGDASPSAVSDFVGLSIAALPQAFPESRCGPGVVNLKVAPVFQGQFRWYTEASGGTPLPGVTGASYTTPILTATTTYYVSRVLPSCETARTPVVAIVANCKPIPELDWAVSNAPGGRVADMYVDRATGTVYTTGFYANGGIFDVASNTNLAGYGSTDVFIAKYDANGTLLWVRGVGGTSQDDTNAITVDKDGNVIVAGYFLNQADFDPGPAEFNLTSAGSWDTFILKLDPDGNFVWAKRIGATQTTGDIPSTVTTDPAGNVYVGGYFTGTVDMDPGTAVVNVTSGGDTDGLILKLDKDGNYLDSYVLRGPDFETVTDLTLDAAGNIFATGYFYRDTDFDPGAGTAIEPGTTDTNAFALKLNSNGGFVWVKTFVGDELRQDGASIDLDSEGNVILGVTFEGTVDFDPGAGVDLHTALDRDTFVLKLDAAGNYVWAKTISTYSILGYGYSAADGTDVYMYGGFAQTLDLDPGAGVFNIASNGSTDAFIIKLDKAGEFQWALKMGGDELDLSMALAFDNAGNIYTGGWMHSDGDFDPGPDDYILSPMASSAGFVVKLGLPTPVFEITTQPASASACEGGIASFTTAATTGGTISYQWQKFDGTAFIDLSDDATYSGTATGTLSVNTTGNVGAGKYRCHVENDSGGTATTSEVDLSIVTSLTAPTATSSARCGPGTVTLTAAGTTDGNYRWYPSATGTALTGEINGSYTTSVTATTTYFVSVVSGSCESQKTPVTATVNAIPAAPATANITRCVNSTVALAASGAASGEYRWYDVATGGSPVSTNDTFTTPELTATVTYYVSAANTTCESARTPLTITITNCTNNQPPSITTTTASIEVLGSVNIDLTQLLSDPDNNLDLATLKIVVQPKSGAAATIDQNGQLRVDYSATTFEGEDELTVEVCDIAGSCVQQVIRITVSGEVTVYNAVSPNGDGKNDVFHIAFIDALQESKDNKVTIFNRWGDVVFEVENYNNTTNVFRGLNNNGNELPSGTYFYRIQYRSARKTETGYLALKR